MRISKSPRVASSRTAPTDRQVTTSRQILKRAGLAATAREVRQLTQALQPFAHSPDAVAGVVTALAKTPARESPPPSKPPDLFGPSPTRVKLWDLPNLSKPFLRFSEDGVAWWFTPDAYGSAEKDKRDLSLPIDGKYPVAERIRQYISQERSKISLMNPTSGIDRMMETAQRVAQYAASPPALDYSSDKEVSFTELDRSWLFSETEQTYYQGSSQVLHQVADLKGEEADFPFARKVQALFASAAAGQLTFEEAVNRTVALLPPIEGHPAVVEWK